MTLVEAYKQAINLPIHKMPHVTISHGSKRLYLQEHCEGSGGIGLTDGPGAELYMESPTFVITVEELVSNNWCLTVDPLN